ncbi:MAG: heavy metal translocating P-type ATPase [Oligoflexia bacterium]|nr:heavy metal translocating P-type ATPase [Oligoflexia bacterium]
MQVEASASLAAAVAEKTCLHCGLPSSGRFCCKGCEWVYSLLQEKGLSDFYRIRDRGRSIRKSGPALVREDNTDLYGHLDDPAFVALYATPAEGDSGDRIMQFYLEGVHCTACVWLTEKVATWVPGAKSVRLDLGHAVATVRMSATGSFAQVAREFAKIGYRPHPVRQDDSLRLETRENRRALIRLAIAAAASGNIMLLAISIYAGATGAFAKSFEWISFGLCFPVATYCAYPFYRSAWAALRSNALSIDIPIALGLLVAFFASVASLAIGSHHVYFDTVSALVFLLLSSRYVLRKTQQEALHASRLVHFLTPSWARRKVASPDPSSAAANDRFEEVKTDDLHEGDRILVLAGECFPVDGVVRQGISTLNCSLLTGESRHELAQPGSLIFAGTLNQQSPLEIEVRAGASATRLSQILRSMEESLTRKAPIVAFTDSISRIFVLVSLALVAVAFAVGWHFGGVNEAISRALAMAIVACPCAFAFATPLALSVTMGRCAKEGILIKGADTLEKLARVDSVMLDKTGTLTTGDFEVLDWASNDLPTLQAVRAIESRSAHPIAQAICRYLARRQITSDESIRIEDFREEIGRGVSARVNGDLYALRSAGDSGAENEDTTQVVIEKNGKPIDRILLGDALRKDARKSVLALKRMGLRVGILSGDRRPAVLKVAKEIQIDPENAISSATPESKSELIQTLPFGLMVGDGANDAVALAAAYVGVAVHSGMEISMRAADVYQCQAGVAPIVRLITVARETVRVIHRGFAFSLVYNALGTVAAISGKVNPLFAAILMPLSALTLFASSTAGTRKLRAALSDKEGDV